MSTCVKHSSGGLTFHFTSLLIWSLVHWWLEVFSVLHQVWVLVKTKMAATTAPCLHGKDLTNVAHLFWTFYTHYMSEKSDGLYDEKSWVGWSWHTSRNVGSKFGLRLFLFFNLLQVLRFRLPLCICLAQKLKHKTSKKSSTFVCHARCTRFIFTQLNSSSVLNLEASRQRTIGSCVTAGARTFGSASLL